jgi:hypothetical protein
MNADKRRLPEGYLQVELIRIPFLRNGLYGILCCMSIYIRTLYIVAVLSHTGLINRGFDGVTVKCS